MMTTRVQKKVGPYKKNPLHICKYAFNRQPVAKTCAAKKALFRLGVHFYFFLLFTYNMYSTHKSSLLLFFFIPSSAVSGQSHKSRRKDLRTREVVLIPTLMSTRKRERIIIEKRQYGINNNLFEIATIT